MTNAAALNRELLGKPSVLDVEKVGTKNLNTLPCQDFHFPPGIVPPPVHLRHSCRKVPGREDTQL